MNNDDYLPLEEFYKQNPINHSIEKLLSDLATLLINEPEGNTNDLIEHFITSFFTITLHCNSKQNASFINALSKFLLKVKQIQLLNSVITYYGFIHSLIDHFVQEYLSDDEIDFYYQNDLLLSPIILYNEDNSIADIAMTFTSNTQIKYKVLTSLIELEISHQLNDPLLKYYLRYGLFSEGCVVYIQQLNETLKVNKAKPSIRLSDYLSNEVNKHNITKALLVCEAEIKSCFLNTKRHTKYFHLAFNQIRDFILNLEEMKLLIESIIPYGSVTQCTQSIVSDLEITVLTKRNVSEETITKLLIDALSSNSNYANVESRLTKRTNLLIIEDKKNKVKIELNFNNVFGVLNSSFIRNYLLYESRALIMVNIIKEWSKRNQINGNHEGYLSSYCFSLMVIFFLQRIDPPVLPVISSKANLRSIWIQDNHYYIENALLSQNSFKQSDNKDVISVLLLKFFMFYESWFDNENYCIDITSKTEVIRNYDITYLNFFKEKSRKSVYCFIDPFDYSYNPGAYFEINTFSHQRFKKILKLSIETMLKGHSFMKLNE